MCGQVVAIWGTDNRGLTLNTLFEETKEGYYGTLEASSQGGHQDGIASNSPYQESDK